MIINNQYKFIFIHVAKAAGTSVSTALGKYLGPVDIDLGGAVVMDKHVSAAHAATLNKLWQETWKIEKHSSVKTLQNRLPASVWNTYFKFAFVRNPYARTYSGFKFMKRHKSFQGALNDMEFSDFLRSEFLTDKRAVAVQPQSQFLNPLDQIDFIGRQETLETDLLRICSIIEKKDKVTIELPYLNQSAPSDEWLNISDADKSIICDTFADDFANFGYDLEDGSIKPITRES